MAWSESKRARRRQSHARTFEDLAEGTTTELLDDSVAFVQNFLAFLKHYLINNY
jgi:hypothetical protein